MPRYFFDLANGGGLLRDDEGVDFDGLELAREFAVQSARDLAASDVRDGREIRLSHFVAIRDAAGAELQRVTFGEVLRVTP